MVLTYSNENVQQDILENVSLYNSNESQKKKEIVNWLAANFKITHNFLCPFEVSVI